MFPDRLLIAPPADFFQAPAAWRCEHDMAIDAPRDAGAHAADLTRMRQGRPQRRTIRKSASIRSDEAGWQERRRWKGKRQKRRRPWLHDADRNRLAEVICFVR
jgi:hypothetical protein